MSLMIRSGHMAQSPGMWPCRFVEAGRYGWLHAGVLVVTRLDLHVQSHLVVISLSP